MSELPRASALGLVASLLGATAALAIDAPASSEAMTPGRQAAVELVSNGVAAKPADDPNCPAVAIAPDGDSRRLDGAKATLDALARDCAVLGAETIVKVGVVGEGERKKKGDAAGFDAPMTIQIKDADGREVETRRINLRVEMPEGVQRVSFRHVEENVSLPPPSANGYANWTIIVGLDPAGPAETEVAADDGELEGGDEQADKGADRNQRSSRAWKSRRYSAARSNAMGRASRYARRDRSRDADVTRQPSGRMAVTLTPQQRAQDAGQGLARVTTEIRPRAVPQPQTAAAPARPAPAARSAAATAAPAERATPVPPSAPGAASSGSDSPWKKVATSFRERRDGSQAQAQPQSPQRARRPAPGQTQAAAQQSSTTQTN